MKNELTRSLQELKERIRRVASEAALAASQEGLRLAQERVPVQSGRLRSSGDARLLSESRMESKASTFYTAPYAPNVHENANSTGYKWLELSSIEVPFEAILRAKWKESQ
jgi:hypothetical protein